MLLAMKGEQASITTSNQNYTLCPLMERVNFTDLSKNNSNDDTNYSWIAWNCEINFTRTHVGCIKMLHCKWWKALAAWHIHYLTLCHNKSNDAMIKYWIPHNKNEFRQIKSVNMCNHPQKHKSLQSINWARTWNDFHVFTFNCHTFNKCKTSHKDINVLDFNCLSLIQEDTKRQGWISGRWLKWVT